MNKKLLISLLSVLVLSSAVVMAEDTTTNTKPEPPKFENGTPPDFVKGQGVNDGSKKGKLPLDFNGSQQGQFDGRRPSKRPDAKPDGDRKPPEWDSSNNQNGQPPEPLQFNGDNSNGRPPLPPDQDKSSDLTES